VAERDAAAYRAVRVRTSELLAGVPVDDLDRPAPATPEWRVRDVLAHVVGVPADALAGNLDGVATDPWTKAQVDARRGVAVADLLAEWDDTGPQFEAVLGSLPATPASAASQAVFDVMTHEQDMRHAIGRPGGRDCDAVAVGFDFGVQARTAMQRPAWRIVTDAGDDVVAGSGDVVATLRTSRFEFVRAITGRRTADEIVAYDWDPSPASPESFLGAPFFTMRTTSLGE
jgi:uncharacterized protein (TIGR03083 family)